MNCYVLRIILLNSKKKWYNSSICRCEVKNENNIIQDISYCRRNNSNKKFTELKNFHESNNKKLIETKNLDKKNYKEHNLSTSFSGKYKIFRDEDAPIIFDVNEERNRVQLSELNIHEDINPYEGLNLSRGINGVFEIEDLIELLQRDKARQIFVASVPKEYSYVDYIVIITGRSPKHMHAVAASVRKMFKMKMYKDDIIPKIEGENSTDWIAMDLGNIVLHIFCYEARIKYDLETLWSVGSEYDDISNEEDRESQIMSKYKHFLKELQPAE